jgi:hypothetical protein
MKKITKLPIFAANRCRTQTLLVFFLCISWLPALGCRIGTEFEAKVSPNIINAKAATYDELLTLIESYKKIRELSAKDIKLTLISGKMESKTRKRFPSVSGYILLRRPDSIFLKLTKPFIGTVLEMLSVGDELSAWRPDKNRFYIGKNSVKDLASDDLPEGFTMRGTHILEAIFPQSMEPNSPGLRISMEEAIDDKSRYYVISLYNNDDGSSRIRALRKIWIERSEMAIARQQFFLEDGQVESDIEYSDPERVDSFSLPRKIHLQRPLDGYAVTLEFKSKSRRINSGLPDDAFILKPPEGAEIVHLKEKKRDGAF